MPVLVSFFSSDHFILYFYTQALKPIYTHLAKYYPRTGIASKSTVPF